MDTNTCRPTNAPDPAPLLCNRYVSDIHRKPGEGISQFPDQHTVFMSYEDINYGFVNLRQHIADLESWLHTWEIKIGTENGTAIILADWSYVTRNIR
jgi:hypothetical protein